MIIGTRKGLRIILLPVALVSGMVVAAAAVILAAGQLYVERVADAHR